MNSVIFILACLFTFVFSYSSGSLKGGEASLTGGTGDIPVLFTTGVTDPNGSFSIINMTSSLRGLYVNSSGDVFGFASGIVTTDCPGFEARCYVNFRKSSEINFVEVYHWDSPRRFRFPLNDVAQPGDEYEMSISIRALSWVKCTCSISKARLTITMPIIN